MEISLEEEEQAKRFAELAAKAEEKYQEKLQNGSNKLEKELISVPNNESNNKVKFMSKKEREELALKKLQDKRVAEEQARKEQELHHDRFVTGKALEERKRKQMIEQAREERERNRRKMDENKEANEHDHEVKAIRDHYLGVKESKKKILKPSEKFTRIFRFEWEQDDDTTKNDLNPLYNNRVNIHPLFGRGYIAGVDPRQQRKTSNYLESLSNKRLEEMRKIELADETLTVDEKQEREHLRLEYTKALLLRHELEENLNDLHWSEKKLTDMTERDWRIFREDFDIRVQAGRAAQPIRYWQESKIPDMVLKGIESAGYEQPSPIQRQAIPIGLEGRDTIGIAETGSGKTAAFLVPLLSYLTKLPSHYFERTRDDGPLAVIMAPTRELAQQIEEECIKLMKFTEYKTCCVVGGQSIEEQGFVLRRGVDIVVGTPGRMVDCLENNYLVLNQCNYVILDEADRMIDMGFEGQVITVLDSMGGLLKSEDESVLEQQMVKLQQNSGVIYRVTAMFSATMPPEVEKIAKTYLRHPVVIRIGDEDSGKNKRIEQQVYFISENQKRSMLLEKLRGIVVASGEKIIIFVNNKKHCDSVGKYIESFGFSAGMLHGGKNQSQREEILSDFKNNSFSILVATDIAGRGLDITDVTHVFNMDMPSKIEMYSHRIGRTGRAGKSGIAISFVTDGDTEILYDLKSYLEATNSTVPAELAKHPMAQAPLGTRDEKGMLIGAKRDQILYAK